LSAHVPCASLLSARNAVFHGVAEVAGSNRWYTSAIRVLRDGLQRYNQRPRITTRECHSNAVFANRKAGVLRVRVAYAVLRVVQIVPSFPR